MIEARLAELRLTALAASLDSDQPPVLNPDKRLPQVRFGAAQRFAISEFAAYQAKRQNLQAAIAQRQAEIHTVQTLIGPLEETAKIAPTRAADYAHLVKAQYVGRHDYLLREQERIAAARDLAAQRSRLTETRSALSNSEEENTQERSVGKE